MNDSLIEKLEALKVPSDKIAQLGGFGSVIPLTSNAAIDSCIGVVRQHHAEIPWDGLTPEECGKKDAEEAFKAVRHYLKPETSTAMAGGGVPTAHSGQVSTPPPDQPDYVCNGCGLHVTGLYRELTGTCEYCVSEEYSEHRPAPAISDVKPGTLPIDIEQTLKALHTQYQFCADAIILRNCTDSPTIEQLGMIRGAHLNIIPILRELQRLQKIERCVLERGIDLTRKSVGPTPHTAPEKSVFAALCEEKYRLQDLSIHWDVADVMKIIAPYLRQEGKPALLTDEERREAVAIMQDAYDQEAAENHGFHHLRPSCVEAALSALQENFDLQRKP